MHKDKNKNAVFSLNSIWKNSPRRTRGESSSNRVVLGVPLRGVLWSWACGSRARFHGNPLRATQSDKSNSPVWLSAFLLVSRSAIPLQPADTRIYMYIRPPTSSANTHITRHILPRCTTHGRGFSPIATVGSVLGRPAAEKQWGLGVAFFHLNYHYY